MHLVTFHHWLEAQGKERGFDCSTLSWSWALLAVTSGCEEFSTLPWTLKPQKRMRGMYTIPAASRGQPSVSADVTFLLLRLMHWTLGCQRSSQDHWYSHPTTTTGCFQVMMPNGMWTRSHTRPPAIDCKRYLSTGQSQSYVRDNVWLGRHCWEIMPRQVWFLTEGAYYTAN